MPLLPTKNEKQKVVFLDAGINLENEPHDLVEFALVGKLYSEKILKLKNPKIALLNIGSEKEKGKQLQREAFELFKNNKEINFYGNIEPRDLFLGKVDVVVTDGYTGNICLKAMEGTGLIIINELKKIFNSNFFTKLCGFFLKKKIKDSVFFKNI
jgi:glycerol-3-phosphate acyltransferase PlsX